MNRQEFENKLKELQRENDKIKKQLEELKNVKIGDDGFPQDGDIYWFINNFGDVDCIKWGNNEIDNYRKDFLRIFKTKNECYRYLEIQVAFKEESKKFKPDWKNRYQSKHYIYYSFYDNDIRIDIDWGCRACIDYFESEEVIKELINRFGEEDIKKYYFGIEK